MATENQALAEWALQQISKSSPMQSIVAVLVVLLMAFPLIRSALKAVQPEHPPAAPPPPSLAPPGITSEWLIATLVGIQLGIDRMHNKQEELQEVAEKIRGDLTEVLRKQETITTTLTALVKLLRRRQSRK